MNIKSDYKNNSNEIIDLTSDAFCEDEVISSQVYENNQFNQNSNLLKNTNHDRTHLSNHSFDKKIIKILLHTNPSFSDNTSNQKPIKDIFKKKLSYDENNCDLFKEFEFNKKFQFVYYSFDKYGKPQISTDDGFYHSFQLEDENRIAKKNLPKKIQKSFRKLTNSSLKRIAKKIETDHHQNLQKEKEDDSCTVNIDEITAANYLGKEQDFIPLFDL